MNSEYASQYAFVGLFALVAIIFPILPLVLAKLVAPKKPSRIKQAAYECGIESTGDPWIQFRVQYYLYALVFVIFDVEVLFVYPWAVQFRALGPAALVEMAIFLGILGVGLAYAWLKGVLEWR
ncbi:MAG: NADH-quinone oxidoreductase subunit A [Candidatus Omnitrophica bacterium]|nr:NADH-quinone oxidoreductase subunit A [Candidatus Omnitrophota bacterium]